MHVNYRTIARTMTAVVGSAVAAVMVSAQAQAAPAYPTPIGPFEYEHECLAAGNSGMENGQWPDYECNGSYAAWLLYPAEGAGG